MHSKLTSIIILSYNSRKDLTECISSLIDQTYPDKEIIIVDNASTDGSPEFVRKSFPGIKLIETGSNLGYPAGNNAGASQAKGKYIIVVNPDTVADPQWLDELIRPLEENPEIALTTSKILMYGQRGRINTCANHSHFTGLDFCRGLHEPSSSFSYPQEVGAVSGCSFAIRREVFEELGGFDPDFFLYLEDIDLSWRARLAGYKILYVPSSIVHHKFRLSVAPWKEFYLERNRYLMLLKNYSLKMLILITPALFVTEIVTWGHAILNGFPYIHNKFRAYRWILANPGRILDKRREIQKNRRVSDKEFIQLLEWKIPFEQVIGNGFVSGLANVILNSFYKFYFIVLKKII